MNLLRPVDLRDPSVNPHFNPAVPHEQLKLKVNQNPTQFRHWNELFVLIDATVAQLYDARNPAAINDRFKLFIADAYSEFLARYPCCEEFWQKWLQLEYQLHGTKQASINVLKRAVDAVPASLLLWNNYVDLLIDDYETSGEDEATTAKVAEEKLETTKEALKTAVQKVGYNFNADSLWDKAIQFLLKQDLQSQDALDYYKTVVGVPLYQYARFYTQFQEFTKQFEPEKVADETILSETTFKDKANDQKKKTVEAHYESLFEQTQQWVSTVWPYESELLHQSFSPEHSVTETTEKEYSKWVEYLNCIIERYAKSPSVRSMDFVLSVFERSLIPNCFNTKLLLKYIAFVFKYEENSEKRNTLIASLFERASSSFIPLEDTELRSLYVKYLSSQGEFSRANEYCFEWIKKLDGSTYSPYMKKPYLAFVGYLLDLWGNYITKQDLCQITENIISTFFDKTEHIYTKKQDIKVVHPGLEKGITLFDNNYVDSLSKTVNASSICVVVAKHLGLLVETQHEKSYTAIRAFYNKYHQQDALKGSTKFWKFMVEHEGIINFNVHNLRAVIKYVKTSTHLPKSSVDALTDLAYDIYTSNYDAVLASGKIDDTIVRHWNDVDNSLAINTDAVSRLSENNYLVEDIASSSSSSSSQPKRTVRVNKEDEFRRLYKLHVAHPAIFTEKSPSVVNSVVFDTCVSLVDEKLSPPSAPVFRNVEKANQAVEYPK